MQGQNQIPIQGKMEKVALADKVSFQDPKTIIEIGELFKMTREKSGKTVVWLLNRKEKQQHPFNLLSMGQAKVLHHCINQAGRGLALLTNMPNTERNYSKIALGKTQGDISDCDAWTFFGQSGSASEEH